MSSGHYYKVLGVSIVASFDQIKRAYRRLALKFHPDVTRDPQTSEKFIEASEAYKVLSDPENREVYDTEQPPGSQAIPQDQYGHSLHEGIEPEEGVDWAMQRVGKEYPELQPLCEKPALAEEWQKKTQEYWDLDGKRQARGAYISAAHLAADIIFQDKCMPADEGMKPAEGVPWAMEKVQDKYYSLWRKPRNKLRWQAKTERYWIQQGKKRFRVAYLRAATEAGQSVQIELGFFSWIMPSLGMRGLINWLLRRHDKKTAQKAKEKKKT
ncbi:MAG: DnaJ domain-containing protein [Planctomycetes bacterium]|nr:DnaJ domain-containing protein [Planctomycetota bacterium]